MTMTSNDKLCAIVTTSIVGAILIAIVLSLFVYLDGNRRGTEERANMFEAGMSQCQNIQSDGRYALYEKHWAYECPKPDSR